MSNSVEPHINRGGKLKILDFFNLQNLTNTIQNSRQRDLLGEFRETESTLDAAHRADEFRPGRGKIKRGSAKLQKK